jgi:hypothetical protein
MQDSGKHPTVHQHNQRQRFRRGKGSFRATMEREPQKAVQFQIHTKKYIRCYCAAIVTPSSFVE